MKIKELAQRFQIPAQMQYPLGLFIFSRLAVGLWLLAYSAFVLKPGASLGPGAPLPLDGIPTAGFLNERLLLWYRWDTVHYLQIALQGYAAHLSTTAWPPLYSFLIYLVGIVIPSPVLAGLLVSNLATLAALVVIYNLVRAEFEEHTARQTLFLLITFPTAFFLTAAYSESLFLALAAGTLWASRRKRFKLAGTLVVFASLTRVLGVLLILPMAWELWESTAPNIVGFIRRALPLALIPIPYLLFAVWVRFGLGAPWPWQTISTTWELIYAPPWTGILGNLRGLFQFSQGYPVPLGTTLLDLTAAGVAGWLWVAGVRRLPVSYSIFSGTLLVASLVKVTNGELLVSTARYVLPLFPLWITQALLVKNRWLQTGVFGIAAILQLLLTAIFWSGFWVG